MMLQRTLLGAFLSLLLLTPVLCVGWEFVLLHTPALKSNWPLLSQFFQGYDAGAQSGLSRAVFRIVLALAAVTILALPVGCSEQSRYPWANLALLIGLVSALAGPRIHAGEAEWETWALLLLLGTLLARTQTRRFQRPLVLTLYFVMLVIWCDALLSDAGRGRVGGVFHEPNILSTFCGLCLPGLLWRAQTPARDGRVAALLVGGFLGLNVWSGSLTGLGFLGAASAFLIVPKHVLVRMTAASLVVGWIIFLNRTGGVFAAVGLPSTLLLLLSVVWFCHRARLTTGRAAVMLASTILTLLLFSTQAASTEQGVGSLTSRDNSLAARLHFYSVGWNLWVESPVLGIGPGGFAHDYPRFQGSVRYFSKFVHCLPLEFLVEWGALGFVCGVIGGVLWWKDLTKKASLIPGEVWRWTAAALLFHSLSGVQSQFPYLFAVLAISYGVFNEPESLRREGAAFGFGRLLLSVALLGSVLLNSARAYSHLEREAGFELYRRFGPRVTETSLAMLESGARVAAWDEQAWYQWGLMLDAVGRTDASEPMADRAMALDSRWAAPYELKFRSSNYRSEDVARALEIDPVNYPAFYRCQAELLFREGKYSDALAILRERAPEYSPVVLNGLPVFRADDLKEQLVEYWVLYALIAERTGDLSLTEHAFRQALGACDNRIRRLRRLVTYPVRLELQPGPVAGAFLLQVAEQIPAE